MRPVPPHVAAYFEAARREQQSWANITQAKLNLKDTTAAAFRVLDSLHLRGQQLDTVEERGEALVESSRIFTISLMPWWKRWLRCMCLPKWWFQCQASPPEKATSEAMYASIEFV